MVYRNKIDLKWCILTGSAGIKGNTVAVIAKRERMQLVKAKTYLMKEFLDAGV